MALLEATFVVVNDFYVVVVDNAIVVVVNVVVVDVFAVALFFVTDHIVFSCGQ